jgi:DNA-binding transcriptional LysR family regulator
VELRNLRTFQVVSEELNLTIAAKILGYTQPTITLQLQVLEREIGHPLFNRVGKKTFLTPAGKLLKHHTEQLFQVMLELETAVKQLDHPRGKLTIAAPEYYCTHHLSMLFSSYIRLHPDVNLKLISSDSKETIDLIRNDQADIGVIAGRCHHSDIESFLLDEEKLVLVVARELANSESRETLFAEYPFITYKDSCNLGEEVKKSLSEMNYTPATIMECGSEEAIRRVVLNKTGIALLSENLIKEDLEKKALVPLFISNQKIQTSLIFLKKRSDESTLQSFSELLQGTWNSSDTIKRI